MEDRVNVLLEEAKAGNRVLLFGPPGTGKTSRIRALAHQLGYKFICTPLHLQERVDLSGAIVPAGEVAKQLPLELVHTLRTSTEPTLWLIDDLGKAPIDVQGALKSLITRYGEGACLPAHVLVWGASNRPEDGAGVRSLDESLRSEFDATYEVPAPFISKDGKLVYPVEHERGVALLGTWDDEVESWCQWAMSTLDTLDDQDAQVWRTKVIAFHKVTGGDYLYRWQPSSASPAVRYPDFRSWESVLRLPATLRVLRSIAARIGWSTATTLLSVVDSISGLPTKSQVLDDPDNAPVPSESSPAAMYMTCILAVHWATLDNVRHILTYVQRFPRTYLAFSARSLVRKFDGNKQLERLVSIPAWDAFYSNNREIFGL
jgi:DNA polymerase III delta prime subunit